MQRRIPEETFQRDEETKQEPSATAGETEAKNIEADKDRKP